MTLEELKIRQMTNQYLLSPSDKLTVARDLCGVQAQFMTNALHSLKIRCNDFDERTVPEGLVKNWSVRGTVHFLPKATCLCLYAATTERTTEKTNGGDILM